jgi:hypothetical protein
MAAKAWPTDLINWPANASGRPDLRFNPDAAAYGTV